MKGLSSYSDVLWWVQSKDVNVIQKKKIFRPKKKEGKKNRKEESSWRKTKNKNEAFGAKVRIEIKLGFTWNTHWVIKPLKLTESDKVPAGSTSAGESNQSCASSMNKFLVFSSSRCFGVTLFAPKVQLLSLLLRCFEWLCWICECPFAWTVQFFIFYFLFLICCCFVCFWHLHY